MKKFPFSYVFFVVTYHLEFHEQLAADFVAHLDGELIDLFQRSWIRLLPSLYWLQLISYCL